MKLINDQEVRFIDEVKPLLTEGAEVFICASYFTINAFFELESELKKVSSVHILVDTDEVEDIRFAYDIKEWSVYHDLKAKFRATQVSKLVNDKCSIRAGSVGGQKFLIIKQAPSLVRVCNADATVWRLQRQFLPPFYLHCVKMVSLFCC